jgi:geranylgeranyl diphosphate synthase, type II
VIQEPHGPSPGGAEWELDFLRGEQRRVEEALHAEASGFLPDVPEPLREAVEYALSTTGKRLRPILCVLAYRAGRAVEAVPEAFYQLSCALELVHTYSLIHDDLPCMDDDDLRRGRPTLHRVFGNARATLAGAALLPLAMQVLERNAVALEIALRSRVALAQELCAAAGAEGMVGGQLLDLESERRAVDGPGLERIHRLKTGALLTAALRIGAIAAGSAPELLNALTQYGQALGLAFQIADDLLDVEGSSADLGKTAGRDLALNKASYPALYGLAGARRLARAKVAEAKTALVGFDLEELAAVADYVVERRK